MGRGLNHALQLGISAAAGSAKLLGLGVAQTGDAVAASAVDNVSLAAVHTEPVSTWKGISPAITGMRAVYATMLAGRGITGPRALFEGPNGLEQLFDQRIDLRTSDRALIAVEQTYLKQYCALIHGQVVIDATLALRDEHGITGADVATVSTRGLPRCIRHRRRWPLRQQGPPVDQRAGGLQPQVSGGRRAAGRSGRSRTA